MIPKKTSEKILKIIREKGQVSAHELSHTLDISPRAIFKQLARLLADGKLEKIGLPPKVYYLIKQNVIQTENFELSKKLKKIIEERYLFITSSGEKLSGTKGFAYWCAKNKLPLEKTAKEYASTLNKYDTFRKNGVIDGTHKIKTTFKTTALNKLFYLDFYSIERFGKTKLGQLLLYAKQSQNKKLMKELISQIAPVINDITKKLSIDGIGFIPPTVKREVQFMKVLEQNLRIPIRTLKINKVKTEIVVPQKTLNKLSDRIENAKRTIIVDDTSQYNNILLIDDAVGSGATLNETATQIKHKKIVKGKIIGLAITGSFKGFDVISEV